jgi:hypothetical protein
VLIAPADESLVETSFPICQRPDFTARTNNRQWAGSYDGSVGIRCQSRSEANSRDHHSASAAGWGENPQPRTHLYCATTGANGIRSDRSTIVRMTSSVRDRYLSHFRCDHSLTPDGPVGTCRIIRSTRKRHRHARPAASDPVRNVGEIAIHRADRTSNSVSRSEPFTEEAQVTRKRGCVVLRCQRQIEWPKAATKTVRQNEDSILRVKRQFLPPRTIFPDIFSKMVLWFSSNLNQQTVWLTSPEHAADDSRKMSRSCSAHEG